MAGELPRGYFKPLAKIIGPLAIWMAAGWAAYPYLIVKISNAIGETVDAAEVELFSYITAPAFLIAGILLTIYGFTGKEVSDEEITNLGPREWPCPHCLKPQLADNEICDNCGRYMRK